MEFECKAINVADGALSSLLVGQGRIETTVLQAYLKATAAEGWRLDFLEKVLQRQFVVSDRATLMITLKR